ncbi:molybdopterin-binding/glycosyltransferase family 2 protein [Fodinicurvata sp. EGI_FJ10296]|uniref:molybdopterin-binding/glycosyltransferase family 2 protein n=1 Tax=Fodinicurvata sp. EGI_FJ10296 TaxID=3231908 RepID=UPI003452D00D
MIFGDLPLDEAQGAYLVHSVRQPPVVLAKGHRLTEMNVESLRGLGINAVTAVRLGAGDVHEDEAARRVARAIADDALTLGEAATGRVNIFARVAGLFAVDRERIDRMNRLDESITIATLPAFEAVAAGQMVATVKIIPFAAPAGAVGLGEAVAARGDQGSAIRVAPYHEKRAALLQTRLPGTADKMLDKTVSITRQRLSDAGSVLVGERRCAHTAKTLAGEIRTQLDNGLDLILIAGASAITDRRDVLPTAVEIAGGVVDHFGMPVDPGNLLLIGHIGRTTVVGLPGCARSPKLNGFDWILKRLCADIAIDRDAIMGMGVGGLLTEIPTRPQPRAATKPIDRGTVGPVAHTENAAPTGPDYAPPVIDAVILAAGQSRRMGAANKLLCDIDGVPMIRRVVDTLTSSGRIGAIHIVTGHRNADLAAALAGTPVSFIANPDFADGLSTSVKAAARTLAAGSPSGDRPDGVFFVLGDMPDIDVATIGALADAFDPARGPSIIVPTFQGKRGHPVLWDSRFLPDFAALTGDIGAKSVIASNEDAVVEIAVGSDGILTDIDTPEALSARNAAIGPPRAQDDASQENK